MLGFQLFCQSHAADDSDRRIQFVNVPTSAQFMSSDKSAKAISGSIIQNSARCLEVLLFSARNVGPVQSINFFGNFS